jgi:hypothetical protein
MTVLMVRFKIERAERQDEGRKRRWKAEKMEGRKVKIEGLPPSIFVGVFDYRDCG